MADIAMLVAEEYERRVKNSRKDQPERGIGEGIGLVSRVSVLAQMRKGKIVQERMELLKMFASEPKTQIGLAASNGFFSA